MVPPIVVGEDQAGDNVGNVGWVTKYDRVSQTVVVGEVQAGDKVGNGGWVTKFDRVSQTI